MYFDQSEQGPQFSRKAPTKQGLYPGHALSHINNQRYCGYCEVSGRRYGSGQAVRSYWGCTTCNVGLCKSGYCFDEFHKLVASHPDIVPNILPKILKGKIQMDQNMY